MKPCSRGKKGYMTELLAEDALINAQAAYDFGNGKGPVAVYQCDECGQWHLTSTGQMNGRLAEKLADGSLHREREANHWLSKLKK